MSLDKHRVPGSIDKHLPNFRGESVRTEDANITKTVDYPYTTDTPLLSHYTLTRGSNQSTTSTSYTSTGEWSAMIPSLNELQVDGATPRIRLTGRLWVDDSSATASATLFLRTDSTANETRESVLEASTSVTAQEQISKNWVDLSQVIKSGEEDLQFAIVPAFKTSNGTYAANLRHFGAVIGVF
jgi:hypothetical protein